MSHIQIIPIAAVAKPRMTQRDKWQKRPAVVRYSVWKDTMRLFLATEIIPRSYHLVCFFPMPKSWSVKRKNELRGRPHEQKPDRDNVDKAWLDMLFGTKKYPGPLRYLGDDKIMHDGRVTKFWWDYPCIAVCEAMLPVEDHARVTPFLLLDLAGGFSAGSFYQPDIASCRLHPESARVFQK